MEVKVCYRFCRAPTLLIFLLERRNGEEICEIEVEQRRRSQTKEANFHEIQGQRGGRRGVWRQRMKVFQIVLSMIQSHTFCLFSSVLTYLRRDFGCPSLVKNTAKRCRTSQNMTIQEHCTGTYPYEGNNDRGRRSRRRRSTKPWSGPPHRRVATSSQPPHRSF